MKTWCGKVAAITGAGSGIGRELAIQLATAGCQVALNDYNPETLNETVQTICQQGGTAVGYPFDVADRAAIYQFAAAVLDQFGQVDLVVNNAGVALGRYDVHEVSDEEYEWIVNINMWGVIHGSRAFLPHLLQRPEATIVNISSVFGLMGIPGQAPYCTTKYAVKGFTESLRRELLNSPVTVSVVHPGGIKTNIVRNSRNKNAAAKAQLVTDFDTNLARTTAVEAATTIIRGIEQKHSTIFIGNDAKFINFATRFFPQKWLDRFIRRGD